MPVARKTREYTQLGVAAITSLLVIVTLTVLRSFFSLRNARNPANERHRRLILQPFQQWMKQTVWYEAPLNTFGNIVMFLPVGFLLVAYRYMGTRSREVRPILMAVAVGFLCSLGIETTQYIFGIGDSDINDVACNTLGAVLAAWVTTHLSRTTREVMCWALTASNMALMLVIFDGLAKN